MQPKKYHAIIFISILIMLLLLGLHLLGIGYSSNSQAVAAAASRSSSSAAAALARNSSQLSSSNQNNQVYRHPIIYDKLTGATNNQINDVLGAKQQVPADYPIDHYQQQAQAGQQQQQQQQQQSQQQFNQLPGDEFFANMHRQPVVPPPGFPAHPMGPPSSAHLHHLRPIGHHPMQLPDNMMMMTTQPPANGRQQNRIGLRPLPSSQAGNSQPAAAASLEQRDRSSDAQQPADSLPSASSLNNNGARIANNNNLQNVTTTNNSPHQQQLAQINQQPIYYTPPIFAYNNFDQNRPLSEPQASGPFAFPHQQQPPLGVPEQPMSIDEYNARQTRLRQLNQQLNQAGISNEIPQAVDRYATGKPIAGSAGSNSGALANEQNLLADPQQQQRHKQQMLDRQLLFGGPPAPLLDAHSNNNNNNNNNSSLTGYYPDPALYRSQMSSGPMAISIRPPYAHSMAPVNSANRQAELNNELAPNSKQGSNALNRISPGTNHRLEQLAPPGQLTHDSRPIVKSSPNVPANHLLASAQQPQFSAGANNYQQAALPQCASRQHQQTLGSLELANSSSQLPVLICNDDPEYPTKEIMRALENYASERPVEQILPQLLVQLHLAQRVGSTSSPNSATSDNQRNNQLLGDIQRQLTLDSLQPSISALRLRHQQSDDPNQPLSTFDQANPDQQQQVAPQQLFPSANYEPMCRSTIYMAQPRRAKNLIGQWKVVVNLPGHKYRGTAVSQMIRIEECSRPNSECAAPPGQVSSLRGQAGQVGPSLLPKSRCLQHYENQRLVAWSSQQGIHVDIFRVPIACSCHIRR